MCLLFVTCVALSHASFRTSRCLDRSGVCNFKIGICIGRSGDCDHDEWFITVLQPNQWPSTGGHCSSSQACTPTCCRGLRTGECRYGIICRCGCRTLTVLLSYRRGIGLLHDTSPQDHNTQQYYEQGYELHVLKFGPPVEITNNVLIKVVK